MNRHLSCTLAGCVIGLAGCTSTPPSRSVDLKFLEHAPVTREQVAGQLGPASDSFEADRVLTYRLRQSNADYYIVALTKNQGWEGVNYDLVLAFDESGVLSQHRMVPIRVP
jgi:hypothetical protein